MNKFTGPGSGRDYRQERADRTEQQAADAYDEAYERIANELIAENIADGADDDYKPSGTLVHSLVVAELAKGRSDD